MRKLFANTRTTCLTASVLLVSHSAFAADNAITFSDDMWAAEASSFLEITPTYLAQDARFDVPAPPANDSAETLKEIEILRRFESSARTPAQLEKIVIENAGVSSELELGLGAVLSTELTEAKDELRYHAIRDLDYFLYQQKKAFKRARPNQLAPDLTTVIEVPGHPAYPSGHAAEFMIVALLFGQIDPGNAEAYKVIANDVGVRREIAGVHYPSDTKAGQALAKQVFQALLNNDEYREKLDEARAMFASGDHVTMASQATTEGD
jgi:hypothetical protein